jgi:hypothetical protein
VVLSGGDPILYLERSGRALQTLVQADDARLAPALVALGFQEGPRRLTLTA